MFPVNCELFLDFNFSFLQSGLRKWPIIDSVTLKLVCGGLKLILCKVNPLCSLWHVSRMSPPCHTSALLLVFVALAVAGAEQSEERSCDVIGDESSESQMERALLKKLEPLSHMRYSTTPCRPWGCTVCQGEGRIWVRLQNGLPLVWSLIGFQVCSAHCSQCS